VSSKFRLGWLGLAGLMLAGCAAAPAPEPTLKTGLGSFVDSCSPATTGLDGSKPCLALGADQRWVLLKDARGAGQFLVVARAPELRLGHYDHPEPALFSAAWAARVCVRDILKEFDHRDVPLDHIGIAINSRFGGSQDRQHIHVDVIRDDVLASLGPNPKTVLVDGPHNWDVTLDKTLYGVTRQATVDDQATFAAMADTPPGRSIRTTLAVMPDPQGGVLILTGEAGPDSPGSAEQDVLISSETLDKAEHDRRNHCPGFRG
jgi:CDP-diacylglycerol pyrophosphatase